MTDLLDSKKHFTRERSAQMWSINTWGQGYGVGRNHEMEEVKFQKTTQILSSFFHPPYSPWEKNNSKE